MKRFVFPGSFDPITLGHQDIIERALPFCDKLVIAVGDNINKKYMFSLDQRIEFIKKTFRGEPKIITATYQGLTIDFCKKIKASGILRGLRNPADFEFEKSIALTNREMTGIETIFFLTDSKNSYISSSIVRDLIKNKGDYKLFIPKGLSI